MSLVAFMLKFLHQYSEHLTKQFHEDKKNAQQPRLDKLEMEYQENFFRCDIGFITTAIEVPSVYLIIGSIRGHFESKDKVKITELFAFQLSRLVVMWILKHTFFVIEPP